MILKLGLKESIDYSKFISSKILYSNQLVENYLAKITDIYLIKHYIKKVIVLDGDNTLWSGILGDEGTYKISKKNNTFLGKIFLDIQKRLKNLKNSGVLLVLCSKNNFKSVEKLFKLK